MPVSKARLFKRNDVALAAVAKALAHPARIAILKTLAARNECVCGEIVEVLPLAQATVSQHLKELKSIGLIKGEVDGPRSCYCIDRDALEKYTSLIGNFFDALSSSSISRNRLNHAEEHENLVTISLGSSKERDPLPEEKGAIV